MSSSSEHRTYTSIRPGQIWLDNNGNRIQAHAGNILQDFDGVFYWYGENKEKTTAGSGIWHWGVRAYKSTDLYNWDDLGLIIPPVTDDPDSPLHPGQMLDRPHIIHNAATGKYVCWLKIMNSDGTQRSTILTANSFLGPYEIQRTGLLPNGMSAGDFDLVVDPQTGRAYYYYGKVHTALICAELTDDYTDVNGEYTTHFPHPGPPFTREAPAHFVRNGIHYLITSGTTAYHPNFSEAASAPSYHGPWTVLGDPHPTDGSRTSFRSQLSGVFRHPAKRDLYIALADRWLPDVPADGPNAFDTIAAAGQSPTAESEAFLNCDVDTWNSDYVWLPLRFDGDMPVIDWHDEWRIEDYD
jgi:hypothetical protein